VHKTFWPESLKRGDHSEDLAVDERIILKWTFGKQIGRVFAGLMGLRIGKDSGLL
jgi:hypothetical protein